MGCSLWSRSLTLGSAVRGKVRLISCKIIFREFQPTEWSKKSETRLNFAITSINVHRFLPFFHCYNNVWCIKAKLRVPPHLYSVTTLLGKTHTAPNIDATCLIYWCYSGPSANFEVGLTVVLNERHYPSEIALFDMFTLILHNTLKTTTSLIDAAVNETLSVVTR